MTGRISGDSFDSAGLCKQPGIKRRHAISTVARAISLMIISGSSFGRNIIEARAEQRDVAPRTGRECDRSQRVDQHVPVSETPVVDQ